MQAARIDCPAKRTRGTVVRRAHSRFYTLYFFGYNRPNNFSLAKSNTTVLTFYPLALTEEG